MRISHLTGTDAPANHKFHLSKNSVIRVITLIKIFATFAPSREVISPRITGITRNFIRVIRVISVQKRISNVLCSYANLAMNFQKVITLFLLSEHESLGLHESICEIHRFA